MLYASTLSIPSRRVGDAAYFMLTAFGSRVFGARIGRPTYRPHHSQDLLQGRMSSLRSRHKFAQLASSLFPYRHCRGRIDHRPCLHMPHQDASLPHHTLQLVLPTHLASPLNLARSITSPEDQPGQQIHEPYAAQFLLEKIVCAADRQACADDFLAHLVYVCNR